MPSAEEIRVAARKSEAEALMSWSIGHAPNANLALLARLIVAVESLEEAVKEAAVNRG